jgi:Putative peptidoglycan binding domain
MNRTLTAAVALATALGMAGLAQAQTTTGTTMPSSPSVQPATPGTQGPNPNMNLPSTNSPSATQNPAAEPGPVTHSGQGLQATTQPTNQNMPTQPSNGMNQTAQATPTEIQQVQQELKAQGLYRGRVDGIMGRGTQTALMAFQREHGLPETAQLDQQTLGQLNGQNSTTPNTTTPNPAMTTPSNSGTLQQTTPNR